MFRYVFPGSRTGLPQKQQKAECPIRAKPDKCNSLGHLPPAVKFVWRYKHDNYDKQVIIYPEEIGQIESCVLESGHENKAVYDRK